MTQESRLNSPEGGPELVAEIEKLLKEFGMDKVSMEDILDLNEKREHSKGEVIIAETGEGIGEILKAEKQGNGIAYTDSEENILYAQKEIGGEKLLPGDMVSYQRELPGGGEAKGIATIRSFYSDKGNGEIGIRFFETKVPAIIRFQDIGEKVKVGGKSNY